MGVCTVEEEKKHIKNRKIKKPEESKNCVEENPKFKKKKSFHNKTIDISLNSKKNNNKINW